MNKSIILYGAFDRYNYGDNLMPVLLSLYIERFFPGIKNTFDIRYASITRSNLTRYGCFKTEKIDSAIDTSAPGSFIVVVGGEVIGATRDNLFINRFESEFLYDLAIRVRYKFPKLFSKISKYQFGHVGDFPYLPNYNNIEVVFNTIGGTIDQASDDYKKMLASLENSAFLSVRDTRTMNSFPRNIEASLSPDSVLILPKLVDDNFLEQKIAGRLSKYKKLNYAVFQASPHKLGVSKEIAIEAITKIFEHTKTKVVLLPIGYASGHDDFQILDTLHDEVPDKTELIYDLSIWEIIFIIKNSIGVYGTSLHNMITALAFGIPHFNINREVKKVTAFLNDWSVAPFNSPIDMNSIESSFSSLGKNTELTKIASVLSDKVDKNNKAILSLITKNAEQ